MIREPCVKGIFYPSDKKIAERILANFFLKADLSEKLEGRSKVVICPHAGWEYSGQTTAYSIKALESTNCYIIISPNHTGIGEPISIFPAGKWKCLFGDVEIEQKIMREITNYLDIEEDHLAHIGEHAIEVIIPFLQYYKKKFKIVPITLAEHDLNMLEMLAEIIGRLINKGEKIGIIASSDFSHFVSEEFAKKRDFEAIEYIKKLDHRGFFEFVEKNDLSICGYLGITVAIRVAKNIGYKEAKVVQYTTSAEKTGDTHSVVAYSSIVFK
ncbi:MAG: AmmeMemoRadiSam system protein B [Candidatus Diapherotrites archaeon]|nr:AmmeMemoRadiSam system protein B [Candidatus Diapherotrites archaeon]